MTLQDKSLNMCIATALNTGGAGNYLLGDQIPLTQVRDIGNGEPVYLVITVATGITVASSTGTIAFRLASDSTASISTTITSSTQHVVTPDRATSTTAIPAGTVLWCAPIPTQGTVYEDFIGILQTTGTTAINAGAINAFLTTDPGIYRAYANAPGI